MRFKFKTQDYQTQAVTAVTDILKGQKFSRGDIFENDFSRNRSLFGFQSEENTKSLEINDFDNFNGFSNGVITLSRDQLLINVRSIQDSNNIPLSEKLSCELGSVVLDVEMETGTGKTYVYTKTIFELNKLFGFTKFIIVVPSIAIREGVKKSLEISEDHFMSIYGKKARHFVYSSKKLDEIEHFSSSSSIQVMIINTQAFNARGADARRIYEELDEFQSRRPIDVIARNRPILILDEPQKMGGSATQESLKMFNPLFTINYSATHKVKHNLVYVLDALDAYNKKLVKKIEVKGFSVKNLRGTNSYIYFDSIIVSKNKPPQAKLEFEINYGTKSINRESRNLSIGDDLFKKSNEMEQYRNGYTIKEIYIEEDSIVFLNGLTLKIGEVIGDVSEDDLRRIQIRETIKSHFEKELYLHERGIKVLSLFFIDEVAKYRKYGEDGAEINSVYGEMFEQEYSVIIKDFKDKCDESLLKYWNSINVFDTHKGYFSIDKHGRKVDSETKKGSDISDDESTYDLILKDKERLLSFEEPTRFIFSHSALREGWDNPNVFQICTLRHTNSQIQKHQEVGRGSRLCVNKYGDRMDSTVTDINVHEVNKLTVIANDSYESFVKGLQEEISNALFERPRKAIPSYFEGKKISQSNGETSIVSQDQSNMIYKYLIANNYLDDNDVPNENYLLQKELKSLAPMREELSHIVDGIHKLIQSVYNPRIIDSMFENGNTTKFIENKINDNFYKEEFQKLWSLINHKYAYLVEFDSNELITKSIESINSNLSVTRLIYTVTSSEQKSTLKADDIKSGESFMEVTTSTSTITSVANDHIEYDLIGKISSLTTLRRKTIGEILKGIDDVKIQLYKSNPEEFISKISKLINDQKASVIVNRITYNCIDGKYDSDIFLEKKSSVEFKNAFRAKKHIKDYVFTDGIVEKSIERVFAEELDRAQEVCVFAKLPRSFSIPTPVGNYSPDWAISFNEGDIKHIYFIAETKGSMDSMQLRKIEDVKIECAKVLFNKLSNSNLKYDKVDSYSQLMSILGSVE
ncbi:MAG: restriction endonuclease subunit R [Firmicutes bacterium HGW-Firmicutes-10]|jgi:type III restriction enzyme|nr:MAG: restriction endonuclease subunit R [Firmicutes bacterium HGW-Firmicutes-10]